MSGKKTDFNIVGFIISLPCLFVFGFMEYGIFYITYAFADLFQVKSLMFDIFMGCLMFIILLFGIMMFIILSFPNLIEKK